MRTVQVDASGAADVGALKDRIAAAWGYSRAQQRLVFAGRVLGDADSTAALHVSVVYLAPLRSFDYDDATATVGDEDDLYGDNEVVVSSPTAAASAAPAAPAAPSAPSAPFAASCVEGA